MKSSRMALFLLSLLLTNGVGTASDFAGFLPPELILITHIHQDHFDPALGATLRQAQENRWA